MKTLYKDNNLEIVIPENYEDNLKINHGWCTNIKHMYDFHTKKLNQTLFRIIYVDGYILSIGVNKNDLTNGHWIDNVKDDKNRPTFLEIKFLNSDIFNYEKIKEIADLKNNNNLLNLANRVSKLSDKAKNSILKELK